MTITFETKCWENDYKFVLDETYLSKKIEDCNYSFDKRIIIINNVTNRNIVEQLATNLVDKNIIDAYYFVEDYQERVFEFFQLSRESFRNKNADGYYYSISELTAIYLCDTDYILHFASDVSIITPKSEWIRDGIKMLQNSEIYMVARPTFNSKLYYENKKKEYEIEDWFVEYWFTDHCYLAKISFLKRAETYQENNELTEKLFPSYGGRDFEAMVDCFLRNHKQFILVNKRASYMHKNWTDGKQKRTVKVYYYFAIDLAKKLVFKIKSVISFFKIKQ